MNRFADKERKLKVDSHTNERGVPLIEHLRDEKIVELIENFLLDIKVTLANIELERKKKIVQSLPKETLLKVVIKNKIRIFEIAGIISPSQKKYLQSNIYPPLPVHDRFAIEWDDEEEVGFENRKDGRNSFFQKILKLLF